MSTPTNQETEFNDDDNYEVEVLGTFNAANDSNETADPEELAKQSVKRKKQEEKYISNIASKSTVQIENWGTLEYEDKKGNSYELDILDGIASLYMFNDQPNDPQYTANATASRGGRPRISDEIA